MSGSIVRLPCASLALTVFNSYPESFIVVFSTTLTSSSDFLDSHL